MPQRLQVVGDGLALMLDPALLERLGIDANTLLEVATDGQRIIVAPVRRKDAVAESTERVMTKHASTFKKLAK